MPKVHRRRLITEDGRSESSNLLCNHAGGTCKIRERVDALRDGSVLVQHNRAGRGQVLRGASGVRILCSILRDAGCGTNDRKNKKPYEPFHRRKIVTMFWPPKPNELFIA